MSVSVQMVGKCAGLREQFLYECVCVCVVNLWEPCGSLLRLP